MKEQNKKPRFHITITDNWTGTVEKDMDTPAIISAIYNNKKNGAYTANFVCADTSSILFTAKTADKAIKTCLKTLSKQLDITEHEMFDIFEFCLKRGEC